MKTIFITIYDGTIAKNILRTDVFEVLKSKSKVVLLVLPEKKDYYNEEFASENVIIETVPKKRRRIDLFFFHLGLDSIHTRTVANRQKNYLNESNNYSKYGIIRIAWFLGQFRLWRKFLRALYFIIPSQNFKELFQKHKPDLVFTPTIISPEELQLLKEAKKKRIKTLGMIKSWDSLTSKTFVVVMPDYLIVHNLQVKKEAQKLGDVPENRIFISGVPQWDIYLNKESLLKKEEFFKKIGADVRKKLILYCGVGKVFNPQEPQVLEIINNLIREGRIKYPIQVLLRLHPKYESGEEKLRDCQNFIIDKPGKKITESLRDWEFEKEDILHLANSLYHCDLMISTASTTTIEGAIFDRPIINIGLDGFSQKDYFNSIIRFYDTEHYKNIVKTGGVRIAKSKEQLIDFINKYLDNPNLDSQGRAEIRKEQCYKLDGKAGERIANYILKLLG